LEAALAAAKDDDKPVIVCGSLYLAGEMLEMFGQ